MSRVRDLWYDKARQKTARHPDNGGNKDAKRWLAIWIDPDGKEKSQAFAKQAQAAAYGRRMEADAEHGGYVDPKAGKAKFGELARRHLRLRGVGGSTRERYDSIYRHHVEPVFGHRPVAAVRASDVVEWLRGPVSKLSAGVQETAYLMVAGTFDLAVADKLRHDNPARSPIVPVPHAEHAERGAWPVEQVWQVRDEHPGPYRALVDCAAGLGLRRGCAFALAEDDFDFEAGKVRIRRQVNRIGRQLVYKLPKGGKERVVPLPRGVAASVQAHMAEYPPAAVTLPWMGEDGGLGDPVAARLLFVWRGGDRKRVTGQCLQAGNYDQDVWKPVLSRLGIIPAPVRGSGRALVYRVGDGRHNGMHALRHVYESMLDDGGVSLAGMMEFMGHSRKGQGITIGVYGHVTEETFERARNAVDQRLFRVRPAASAGTVTELRRAQ